MAGPPDEVERLRNHLLGAVQRSLRMCDAFTLHVTEDVASAVLAALCRQQSDVPFALLLFVPPGHDASLGRRLAKHLGLPLVERRLGDAEVERLRSDHVAPANPIEFKWVASEARLLAPRLLVAYGAGEMMAGTPALNPSESPERLAEANEAKSVGLEVRYPYLDRGVVPYLARLRDANQSPRTLLGLLAGRLGMEDQVLRLEGVRKPRTV